MAFFGQFSKGFLKPFGAFRLVFGIPALLGYAIVPIVTNTLLFIGGFWALWSYRVDVVELIWTYPENAYFLAAIWHLLAVLIFGFSLLVGYFMFTPIGCIIAAPFNDRLAGRTEQVADPDAPGGEIPLSFGEIYKMIRKELGKLGAMLLVLFAGLVLSLIPVLGPPVAFLVVVAAGSWMLCLEYLDYPMSRHGYGFSEIASVINSNLGRCLGFGAGVMLLLLIPFLNLVCIPVSVAGVTVLFVELRREGLLPPPGSAGK